MRCHDFIGKEIFCQIQGHTGLTCYGCGESSHMRHSCPSGNKLAAKSLVAEYGKGVEVLSAQQVRTPRPLVKVNVAGSSIVALTYSGYSRCSADI